MCDEPYAPPPVFNRNMPKISSNIHFVSLRHLNRAACAIANRRHDPEMRQPPTTPLVNTFESFGLGRLFLAAAHQNACSPGVDTRHRCQGAISFDRGEKGNTVRTILIAIASAPLIGGPAGAQLLTPGSEARPTTATPRYVYANAATGERMVVSAPGSPRDNRGTAWSWSNRVADPCAPDGSGESGTTIVFAGVHNATLGDEQDPRAINHWHDWFEHPGDTVISALLIDYFTQVPDPGLDGVEGCELILVFTENDDHTAPENAVAHSPILLTDLPGAEDQNGDGEIEFLEGELWVFYLDLWQLDTDIEVGDTNGVSDGAFGPGSVFSGIPGVDTDGDGLINSGFVIGFRQPDVAEGDSLLVRFPELIGIGLENPDGDDPATYPNIHNLGTPLLAPSANINSYIQSPGIITTWPSNPDYSPLPDEAVGAVDGFGFIDGTGAETLSFFGGFACTDPPPWTGPYTQSPWAGWGIAFNPFGGPGGHPCWGGAIPCSTADIAEPFAVLDLADISRFIRDFLDNNRSCTDFAEPIGVLDLADITLFLVSFQAGCP